MAEPLLGKLLVATPALLDPNFARTVVLICDENEHGKLGIILNRPFRVEVATYAPEWGPLASPPARVFEGGPVAREGALAVGRLRDETPPAAGWIPITDTLGIVDLDASPADFWGDLVGLRVFSGYAGWGAGQLEDEIAEQAWFVLDSAPADPFDPEPTDLWEQVLRRQGGDFSAFAPGPGDPASN